MTTSDEKPFQLERLEARIAVLEQHVQTLTAAADAASRLRLTCGLESADVRVTGGEWVRHILEKGGLVDQSADAGFPE